MASKAAAESIDELEVEIRKQGCVGVITLNRPKALNALNLEMIRDIMSALQKWEEDSDVACVLIEGAGDKAFCAGGDIRAVYEARLKGDRSFKDAIFREEYALNYYISQYKKPYISLIDGICMGGGMGLSIHGRYRLVSDKTVMAMPETAIGFFTDIGASYFLNKCPGYFGYYMGLVGEKITVGDALYAGLATHYIPSEDVMKLRDHLLKVKQAEDVDKIISQYTKQGPEPELGQHQEVIDAIFNGKTVEDIIKRLEERNQALTNSWLTLLTKRSPTSLKVTLKLLQKTKKLSLKEALGFEFRLSQRFVENYDFFEGVRALLIDKDQSPQWLPSYLVQVSEDQVKDYFKPMPGKELDLR